MFDPASIEKVIVAIFSHPAMAEVTAIVSIAVSIAQNRKPQVRPRSFTNNLKKYVEFYKYGVIYSELDLVVPSSALPITAGTPQSLLGRLLY